MCWIAGRRAIHCMVVVCSTCVFVALCLLSASVEGVWVSVDKLC